jgi:hypothetical protein
MENIKIDYDVVTEMAGHQENRGVELVEAVKDIFFRAKEKAMEVAVKGNFIQFDTVDELSKKLVDAATSGFSIKVYDQVIGG